MKISQETVDAKSDRKLIKSQVEKRRRERLNRSLERLRTMLLQEPQRMGGTQHRVEKAEILERTVLFLQGTAGDPTRPKGGGGGQKRSFQDGFSTCLQRAAQFLGPEGKGLWLGAALDASFAARFAGSDSESAALQKRTDVRFTSGSLSHTKFILQMLRQKYRQDPQASGSVRPSQASKQQGFPAGQQEHPEQNTLDTKSEAGKQPPPQSLPASHPLWRPWP